VEIEHVAMDGWLLSGKRSGVALIMLPSGDRVPVNCSTIYRFEMAWQIRADRHRPCFYRSEAT
jgi:hypothetical protein